MEITDVETIEFSYESRTIRDEKGHTHPGPPRETVRTLTRIETDAGVDGHYFGGTAAANAIATKHLVGENPLERERLWEQLKRIQRLRGGTLSDRALAAIDCALWDLAGRYFDQPVYRLLGGHRDRIPAYGSTMVGDDDPDGLGTPDAYADFVEDLVEENGYSAVKLHTWMPPYGADPARDAAAARAVRERVGPDVDLMVDSHHWYSRTEALELGRALEELDYAWFEEPMDEHSMSAYEWLSAQLDIPVIGPETAEGKMQTRAEWIKRGIADISRVGVFDVGGISPAVKTVHLCESFAMPCEVHGGGAPSLHLLAAMVDSGEYYERGLLHPDYDYEEATPWLSEIIDPLDDDGYVPVPQKPGLGYDIDWEFIDTNRVS